MEHYFTADPTSARDEKEIYGEFFGRQFVFLTDAGVFSKDRIDRGTELLIKNMEISPGDKVLDLGCGYGPIGIVAGYLNPGGKIIMADINKRAVELARRNVLLNGIKNAVVLESDGFAKVDEDDFDKILMNPPLRAGKKVVYGLVESAWEKLVRGGALYTVALTRQGAKSLAKKIESVFGNVEIVDRGSGYRVHRGVKY